MVSPRHPGREADDADFQAWWERTFSAREAALDELFGPSHPPGSPEGHVLAFGHYGGSGEHQVLIPSACAHVYPPRPAAFEPELPRRHWLYVTVGLSQPADPADRPWDDKDRGTNLSGAGLEFAMSTPDPHDRAAEFLREMMGYHVRRSPMYEGHRIAGGFYEASPGRIEWFLGVPERDGIAPADLSRAFLFWPLLGVPRWFTTETGNFEVLCATNITAAEWAYAKETSSAHLQVLLCRAGVGQCTRIGRSCLISAPETRVMAEALRQLSREEMVRELRSPQSFPWL